jgi:hypothetical protein
LKKKNSSGQYNTKNVTQKSYNFLMQQRMLDNRDKDKEPKLSYLVLNELHSNVCIARRAEDMSSP